jgi:lysyl-tRNA synthetase class 2
MTPFEMNFDQLRLEKVKALNDERIPPYPHTFNRKETIGEIRDRFQGAGHEKSEDRVQTAGRLFTIRNHGKTIFADIGDEYARIQIYVRNADIGEEAFRHIRDLDRGDIVGVSGHVFRTKLGEITIWADEIRLLAKALCPLPEKFHGLKDVEKRYRQRYVDLIVNEESREKFRSRSRIIAMIRRYLDDRGFLEFETPILQPIYGGANARPFTTYHHFLDQTFYLRIAPELYLKRLIVGGFEKIFEVARNFRNEDIDTSHNPEFSMVEIYEAFRDYREMMALTEGIISHAVHQLYQSYRFPWGNSFLDFTPPWKRMSMEEAVREYAGIDVFSHTIEELREIADHRNVENWENAGTLREFLVLLFEELVEGQLEQPIFVHDFPIENSPLAKRHREKEGFTERFELFIRGMEVANGFSELNDPLDQGRRFEAQEKRRLDGDLEAQMIDNDFITALGYGMPPTGGVGIGIDRLVMILTGSSSIKEVILFPQMKSAGDASGPGELVQDEYDKSSEQGTN